MTWTYSGDPSASAKDEIRFLIGDTDQNDQLISDEEVAYLVSVAPDQGTGFSNYGAASAAAFHVAAKFSKLMDKTVGSLSISYSQKADAFLALAQQLSDSTTLGARKPGAPQLGGGGMTYLGGAWR